MLLRDYLANKGIAPAEFAALVGHSEAGVKKWIRGERQPRPDALAVIAKVTKGAVTANDFVEARAA